MRRPLGFGMGPDLGCDCASFNQDSTSLALGTKTGYKLFSLPSVDKLDCIYESAETPDVCIIERLFSSSLVVVVSSQMPQRMNIYHFKKGTEICNYSYPQPVLAVKLNRQRLVVCLKESIYIHSIKDMKLLKTLLSTPSNPSGLCALSVSPSSSYLVYPGSISIGEVIVYDANSLNTVTMIPAHESPLAALSFNASASRLASASERGTVIRVFSIPEGLRLFEFRRGMKRYVNISSLSFSPDEQFLCASSNTETVHIFKMDHISPSEEEEVSTWGSYVGRMFSAASTYLPAQVSDMMSQDRAFATVHLLTLGHKNMCTLATIQKLPRLLVATADGQLFIYNLDPQEGGECRLAHKHWLLGVNVDQTEAKQLEGSEVTAPGHTYPTYAATAALPATGPITATLTGYCEDGGCKKGEVIPEHELAVGPVRLDDETEFPPVDSQLAFVRDNLRHIYELYRDGNLSSVGWDTKRFLPTVYSQMSQISHCVSQNKSENLDVRKYYWRLRKSTVERTNGSLASWKQIRNITGLHLHRLNFLVQSITSSTTLGRHSRKRAPERITRTHYSRDTALELITRGHNRTQTHLSFRQHRSQ